VVNAVRLNLTNSHCCPINDAIKPKTCFALVSVIKRRPLVTKKLKHLRFLKANDLSWNEHWQKMGVAGFVDFKLRLGLPCRGLLPPGDFVPHLCILSSQFHKNRDEFLDNRWFSLTPR
jgi:hypothetical protein